MITVNILERASSFAENKDVAANLREKMVLPSLAGGEDVTLDFEGVDDATQSFVHALVSEAFREYGSDVLERITFKNCNERVRGIITLVTVYMQESL